MFAAFSGVAPVFKIEWGTVRKLDLINGTRKRYATIN